MSFRSNTNYIKIRPSNNKKTSIYGIIARSQIKQNTERFFYQYYFFEYFQNTTSGMDEFFSLRLKIKVYGKNKSQKNQTPMTFIEVIVDPPLKFLHLRSQ
ncbi:MAG: hypothetical protein DRH26_13585 [Deltaproteobacteria bacterium]|nr:MAG: hypothetical protein DRH26_13585 [Deltaproteobacteria bacterium]